MNSFIHTKLRICLQKCLAVIRWHRKHKTQMQCNAQCEKCEQKSVLIVYVTHVLDVNGRLISKHNNFEHSANNLMSFK